LSNSDDTDDHASKNRIIAITISMPKTLKQKFLIFEIIVSTPLLS